METNPFGITEGDLPDFVTDSPSEEPEPVETPEEVLGLAPEAESESPPQPDAEPAPEATEEGTEEKPKLWAKKYRSAEELERGYNEIRDLQRRTAERANAADRRAAQIEEQARLLERTLQRAIPMLQQQQQLQQRPQSPQQQVPPEDWDEFEQPQPPAAPQFDPRMVLPMVDQMVQERLNEFAAGQQAQTLQQVQTATAQANLESFYREHPDIQPEGEKDQEIAQTIQMLSEAWGGQVLDLAEPDAFEIALEATERPALRRVLELHPEYTQSEVGKELARAIAATMEGGQTQPTTGKPAPAVPRKTPVVERGVSGTPEPQELDEFDQGVAELRAYRNRDRSVFFE